MSTVTAARRPVRLLPGRLVLCLLVLGGVFFVSCRRSHSRGGAPRVRVEGELIEGSYVDAERTVASFKGLRYAAPPVGDLRWRPPARVEKRSGVQRAVEYGPSCPQNDAGVQHARDLAGDFGSDPAAVPDPAEFSEDCLYLNVWTPSLEPSEPLPVLVWIHGGSNVQGGADRIPYDGASLARRGVVVVTLNYRLGLLGFLAHPALSAESANRSSGNYGLLDQVAALEWVARNASAFGGDSARVTLSGHSTGGSNVLYLMTSPLAEGLFHRAISQSGSPVGDLRTLGGEETRGLRLQELLGIQDSDSVLAELRAAPVETLLEASPGFLNREFDCSPVTDGWAVPDLPGRVFASGKQHDVPLLIGSNSEEWTSIGRYADALTVAGFSGWLRSRWGRWSDRAAQIYTVAAAGSVPAAVRRWQTDHWFSCPAGYTARSMAGLSSPAFLYRFTRRAPGEAGERLGAYHGAEVAYVFDNLAAESWIPRRDRDAEVADAMAGYWVAFARDGAPRIDGLPAWPGHDAGEYLEVGDELVIRTEPRSDACLLWERRLETELGLN